jgi:RHS repeat-associated protein
LTDVTWSGAVSGTLHRAYSDDLRVISESVNGGNAVAFGHDADGLLTSAGPLTLGQDTQNGRVTELSVGAVGETRTFDSFGDLQSWEVTAEGSALMAVSYTRDALGRIVEKTETVAGETHTEGYIYDLAGRLSDFYRDGLLAAHHEYDENGNRITRVTPAAVLSGAVDAQDRLLSYGALSFTYQPHGALQSRTDTTTGETTLYSYDPLGNLREVTLPDGTVIEYVVDGLGRRVGKKVSGALVRGWLYRDALQPAVELDASGNVVARFLYGERVNVPEVMIKGGTTYRIVTDHLGSVRLVVDAATGVIAQRIDYDELGRVLLDTSPGLQPFGFAGGLYDPDTRLTRFGARDYDPETGRWTVKDPLLFEGGDTNLYAYALGDPVNRVDPNGRDSVADYFCFLGGLLLNGGVFGVSTDDLVDLCFPGPPDANRSDTNICKDPYTDTENDCDDKYRACINHGPTECQRVEAGKTQCQRCWERCNAGDAPSRKCRKCGF